MNHNVLQIETRKFWNSRFSSLTLKLLCTVKFALLWSLTRHLDMKILLIILGLLGLGHCGIFTRSKCVDVPSNLCAVVYDDEKCNGWALNINEGEVCNRMIQYYFKSMWKNCVQDHVQVVGPCLLLVQEWHWVRVREEGLHLHRLRRQQPQRGQLHHQIGLRQGHVSQDIKDIASLSLNVVMLQTRDSFWRGRIRGLRREDPVHLLRVQRLKPNIQIQWMSKYWEIRFRKSWLDSWLLKYLKIKMRFLVTLSVFLYDGCKIVSFYQMAVILFGNIL